MSKPYTPPRSHVDGNKPTPSTRTVHPVLRIVYALFGFAALLIAVNITYDILNSSHLDMLTLLGISSLFCLGLGFAFLGLAGRYGFRR